MTPREALQKLQEGHARFLRECAIHPNADSKYRAELDAQGQRPFSSILSCSDSRVPVEIIFDAGIGDLFVVRAPGNVCRADQMGALEFGIGHFKTPLCVIMGHTNCGAILSLVKGEVLHGYLGDLVNTLAPSVQEARSASVNPPPEQVVELAARHNVQRAIRELTSCSRTIRERVERGDLEIIGAIYNVLTGNIFRLQ